MCSSVQRKGLIIRGRVALERLAAAIAALERGDDAAWAERAIAGCVRAAVGDERTLRWYLLVRAVEGATQASRANRSVTDEARAALAVERYAAL